MAVLAFRRVLELGNRGKAIFEQGLKDVKESVTNDFSWIRDEAFQKMGGQDGGGQTVVARGIEDVAKGILQKLGLPTETEANLDLDLDVGDPVDLFLAILNEATGMRTRGLNASPLCARRILHLARAVEQWHEAEGFNQLRRVAPGSEPGSSFTEMTRQGQTQVTGEAFGTSTGDCVRNEGSTAVRTEQLDAIEEETTEESALLFCNEDEKRAIVKEIQGAARAGEGLCPACWRVLQSEPGHTCERCLKVILPTSQPQTYSCHACQWSICFDCRLPQKEQQKMDSIINLRLGRTRLHLAAQEGDVPALKSLLRPDTNINCRDVLGRTPLHSSVASPEVVDLLIQRGADVAARDNCNQTPLDLAAWFGHKEVVDLLIQHGADVLARENDIETPLHRAAIRGHKEVVDLLIQRGADVSARNKYNQTSLHLAVLIGHKELVDLLIQRRADVAARDKYNRTPLHLAVRKGHRRRKRPKQVVDLLIQHGADVAACDTDNETPLHCAAEDGRKELVDLLIRCGADVWAFDKDNRTPLHKAAAKGRKGVVDLLIQRGAGRWYVLAMIARWISLCGL